MSAIGSIKHKVIIVDYVPASHGHFIIDTLHSLMLGQTTSQTQSSKNYHHSTVIPQPVLWGETLEQPLDLIEFVDRDWINKCERVFWPAHWSNYWIGNPTQSIESLRNNIDRYPILEIYVGKEFYFRWLINWWFNVGTVPKEDIKDNKYFVDNFYKIADEIQNTRLFTTPVARAITNDPANYVYSHCEVVAIIEEMIKIAHSNTYQKNQAWSQRPLKSFRLTNKVISFDMANFYSYNKFVDMISKIKTFFALKFDINNKYLTQAWNGFISNQYCIRVDDESVPDCDLHVIEQAYRSYLKKCKTFKPQ